jgi:hypothetical protein
MFLKKTIKEGLGSSNVSSSVEPIDILYMQDVIVYKIIKLKKHNNIWALDSKKLF